MGNIRFTPRAETDLYGIWLTIAVDNERAADGVVRRIMAALALASDHPLMGTPRAELSPTARLLVQGRYLAIYEPKPDGVEVVAIVHGMRDPAHWLDRDQPDETA